MTNELPGPTGTDVNQKDILRILTEDIHSHRDYVQRLYLNAAIVGGVILAAGVAGASWFVGDRYDASLLQTVVNKDLREQVDSLIVLQTEILEGQIVESVNAALISASSTIDEARRNAIEAATKEVNQYATEQLFEEVTKSVEGQLAELASTSAVELAAAISFPSGMVAAFDLRDGCPLGWCADMSAAAGRVIIGVDGSKYKLPYVSGKPEYQMAGEETHTLSVAEMPTHTHLFNGETVSRGGWGGQATRTFAVGGSEAVSSHQFTGEISATGGGRAYNNMPPYIVLYYCKKE